MHFKYPKIDQIFIFFPYDDPIKMFTLFYKIISLLIPNLLSLYFWINKLRCIIQFKKRNKMQSLLILHF